MSVSESQLHSFEQSLLTYGRSAGTASMYVRNVRLAYEGGGPLRRLKANLAPKTKRHILAACRAYARFTSDDALLVELGRMKLPPAVRQAVKVPLERDEWFALIDAIREHAGIGEPMRAVLGMMAMRGFRCGDVVRMRRVEIEQGLSTGTLSFLAKGDRQLEFSVIETYRQQLEVLKGSDREWTHVEDLLVTRRSPAERRHRSALRAVQRALSSVAASAGIGGVYPHRLRRTYATEYLRSMTGDPEAVVKLMQHMGWSNIATAMEYVNHQRGAELNAPTHRMFDRNQEK